MYENTVIGCESEGDPPGEEQWQALEYLMGKVKCNIVIGASRTRGITVKNVLKLSEKYKYKVIWFTPSYVYYPMKGSVDNFYNIFAQKNAEIVMELIRLLISGTICAY